MLTGGAVITDCGRPALPFQTVCQKTQMQHALRLPERRVWRRLRRLAQNRAKKRAKKYDAKNWARPVLAPHPQRRPGLHGPFKLVSW